MERHRRTGYEVDGAIEASAIAGSLGRDLRTTAKRRRLTQAELARRVGLSGARVGEMQRGQGATAPLETWVKLGKAIGRRLAVSFSREIDPHEPRDAGHLAAQELVLGLARRHGRHADFELPTRPTDPARSIDVALRDGLDRTLIVVDHVNRLDDLGAAARATTRKVPEAEDLATVAAAAGRAYRASVCWLLVDTAANRRLVARYPEILQSRFPGSSLLRMGTVPEQDLATEPSRGSPGSIRDRAGSSRCGTGRPDRPGRTTAPPDRPRSSGRVRPRTGRPAPRACPAAPLASAGRRTGRR